MSIKLNLKGWEDYISQIEKAGASVNQVCANVIREDAQIMDAELKSQMAAAGVSEHLISDMDNPEITTEGNRFTAIVGYKKGPYGPKNITNAYKVIFLNYGTPKRTKHGKVKARGFIQKAKSKAKTKIKKANEAAFQKIIAGLK